MNRVLAELVLKNSDPGRSNTRSTSVVIWHEQSGLGNKMDPTTAGGKCVHASVVVVFMAGYKLWLLISCKAGCIGMTSG